MDKSYLIKRGDVWWYNRRVPGRFQSVDPRKRIRLSLDTYALEEACLLRDQLVEADNQYWAALELEAMGNGQSRQAVEARYKAANARAQSAGFSYRPVLEIAKQVSNHLMTDNRPQHQKRTKPQPLKSLKIGRCAINPLLNASEIPFA